MDATSKLSACAVEGCYVGHDFVSNGVRVYWTDRHSVTVERTVIYITNDIVMGEPSKEDLQNFNLPPVVDNNDDMPNLLPFDDDPINDRSPNIMPQEQPQGPPMTMNRFLSHLSIIIDHNSSNYNIKERNVPLQRFAH